VDYKQNLDLSLAGLSYPLFIGCEVSRVQSGSIQISLFKTDYNTVSYFDYDYALIPILGLAFMRYHPNRPQGYQHCRPWYSYPFKRLTLFSGEQATEASSDQLSGGIRGTNQNLYKEVGAQLHNSVGGSQQEP
jgi:hypothetical protein